MTSGSWKHGEKKCLLCNRPGYPTEYHLPNPEESELTATIPLCQYHKGKYMAHGIKRLDSIMIQDLMNSPEPGLDEVMSEEEYCEKYHSDDTPWQFTKKQPNSIDSTKSEAERKEGQ